MEQRLIDANALKKAVNGRSTHWLNDWSTLGVLAVIDEQPTVDAVPVVRCEKCRHGIKAHGISDGWVLCSKPYVTDTVGNMMHRCDWYCADGERGKEK